MRHLETYTGEDPQKWSCGFKSSSKKTMNGPRIKYLYAIISSVLNEKRQEVIDASNAVVKEIAAVKRAVTRSTKSK